MIKHTPNQKKQDHAIPDGIPMGFPMLPPEVVAFMNAPEVVALATTVQLSTPVIAIALAAKRWLSHDTPNHCMQTWDVGPPMAEVVEHPDEIVVCFRSREVRFSHHAAAKIFELFQRLDPYEGAPKAPKDPDTQ